MTQANLTRQLAAFVSRSRWEDLPGEVRHEAKRSILNFFGTALGGCRDRATQTAYDVLAPFAGPQTATIIGRAEREADPLRCGPDGQFLSRGRLPGWLTLR